MRASFAWILVGSACASAPPKAPGRTGEAAELDPRATVTVTHESGSCWGRSEETRTVTPRTDRVLVSHPGATPDTERSLAWWDETRALLDGGLAVSTSRDAERGCYRSNFVCGFTIQVGGPSPRTFTGCCSGDRDGIVLGFRRLKPGGPLGPDEAPAP